MMSRVKKWAIWFIYAVASILPQSLVFGSSYRKARSVLAAYENAKSPEKFVHEFHQRQLAVVLSRSKQCEYYRSQELPLTLPSWPFIDKDVVLNHQQTLLRTRVGADLMTTGGTSGQALAFYINKNRKGIEWFWMTHGWGKIGFDSDKSWRGVLRNHHIHDGDFEINSFLKKVYFDNFRLNDDYMARITRIIEQRQIEFIHAYPSAAYTLALYWQRNNNMPVCIKGFLCGSETVFPHQKQLIQQELKSRMYTWYGHSEKLILAQEGQTCENYHTVPFYGFAELVDENGQAVITPGQTGELVGTSYINDKTCFVRYKTGDYAEYVGHVCPECGHVGLTFKATVGRWGGDRIYLDDGNYVTTTALNLHDEIYTHIDGMQYYQDRMGALEVRVVINDKWTESSAEALLKVLQEKVPANLVISLKIVKELILTKNGKYQLIIQKVKV